MRAAAIAVLDARSTKQLRLDSARPLLYYVSDSLAAVELRN